MGRMGSAGAAAGRRREDQEDLSAQLVEGRAPEPGDAQGLSAVTACCLMPGAAIAARRRSNGDCETLGLVYEPLMRGKSAIDFMHTLARGGSGDPLKQHEAFMREAVTRDLLGGGGGDDDDGRGVSSIAMDVRCIEAEPLPPVLHHDMQYAQSGALLVGPGAEPAPLAPDASIPVVLEAASRARMAREEEEDGLPDDGAFVNVDGARWVGGRRNGDADGDGWGGAVRQVARRKRRRAGEGRDRRGRHVGASSVGASLQDQALLESFPRL